jgi:hypothetical protein
MVSFQHFKNSSFSMYHCTLEAQQYTYMHHLCWCSVALHRSHILCWQGWHKSYNKQKLVSTNRINRMASEMKLSVYLWDRNHFFKILFSWTLYSEGLESSPLCSQRIFMSSAQCSQQAMITSPYNIFWLIFVMETCVYCEVELSTMYVTWHLCERVRPHSIKSSLSF